MSAINGDTVEAWREIAKDLSAQRPYPGRRVEIVGGRKHKGRVGVVLIHCRDQYSSAFRYGGEANLHMREMAGRDGFVVKCRDEMTNEIFWCKADYTKVLDEN
jgi:hypothetical protein